MIFEPSPVRRMIPRSSTAARPTFKNNGFPFFEIFFVLFLFAGQFKADPRLAWAPVDLTYAFFGLSLIFAGIVAARGNVKIGRQPATIIMLYLIFMAWSLFTYLWGHGNSYALDKMVRLTSVVLWSLAGAAILLAKSRQRTSRMMVFLLVFAIFVGMEAWKVYGASSGLESIRALGGNYIGLGRIVGAGALVAAAWWLAGRGANFTTTRRWLAGLIFLALSGLLLVIGSRGPSIALIAALSLLLFTTFRSPRGADLTLPTRVLPLIGVFVFGAAVTGYFWSAGESLVTLDRLMLLASPDLGPSAGARVDHYIMGLTLWAERPLLGHGIGSWPVLTGSDLSRDYPHNLVIEILVETGAIGLILFIGLVSYSWQSMGPLRAASGNPLRLTVPMLFLFFLLNSMVSGDLPDNRALFMIMGLAPIAAQADSVQRASSAN